MEICIPIFLLLILIGATVAIIMSAVRSPEKRPVPAPFNPEPNLPSRNAQEILQLRNHITRLEQRISVLEVNLDVLSRRSATASPQAPAVQTSPVFTPPLHRDSAPASHTPSGYPVTEPPQAPDAHVDPAPKPAQPPKPSVPPAPKPVTSLPQNLPPQPIKAIPPVTPLPAQPISKLPPTQPIPGLKSEVKPPVPPVEPPIYEGIIEPEDQPAKPTPAPAIPQPIAKAPEPATPPVSTPVPTPTPAATPIPPKPAEPQPKPLAPAPLDLRPAPNLDPVSTPAIAKATPAPIKPAAATPPPLPISPVPPIPPTPAKPQPSPTAPLPKRAPITLEGLLTTRFFVWIAGIVLSLAGILFMKYLNDRSVFPEWTRLVLGAAIGFAGLGAGEYFRKLYQRIAATVVGAGLTTLFAVVLTGTLYYDYIPKPIAFVLLVCIALGAVGLSLRHGMLVAVLGLLGGYITPALLSTGEPKPVALALYLVFLQTGLVLVIRKRGWMPLAALTLLAAMVWAGLMVFMGKLGANGLPIALLLVSTGVQFALVLDRPKLLPGGAEPAKDPQQWVYRAMGLAAVAMGLFLLSTRVALGEFQVTDWGYLGIVSLALILLGRLKQGYSLLPYFGLAATSFLFFQWMRVPIPEGVAPQTAPGAILAGLAAVFTLGGMLAGIKGPHPARFAGLSALAAAIFAGIGYWFQEKLNLHGLMPYVAILGTGVYCLAASLVQIFTPPSRNKTLVMATYLVAASGFALAIAPLWFENWIAPAWAAQVLIMAIIARRFKIPFLHGLAMPIALLAFARLTFTPDLLTKSHADIGLMVWILSNYLPVLSFLGAGAWVVATDPLLPEKDQPPLAPEQAKWFQIQANVLGSLAQILLGIMLTFLFRAAFLPGSDNLWANARPSGTQFALWTSIWLALAFLASILGAKIAWLKNNWLPWLWMVAGSAGCVMLVTVLNPLLPSSDTAVGATPVLNLLLVLYGLPTLAAGLVAWGLHKHARNGLHNLAVTLASIMGILLVMLQVRHGFTGSPMNTLPVTLAQAGAYTLAGLLSAIGVRQAGRAIGWEASSNVTAGYLLLTGLLFVAFQGIFANPFFHPDGIASTLFFNQILLAFGAPALILLAGSDLLKPFTTGTRIIGAVLLALATALLIRQGFHPHNITGGPIFLTEAGTYTIIGLILTAALRPISQYFNWPGFDMVAGGYLSAIAIGFLALQIVDCNPLFHPELVSPQIFFNSILYAYGLPALMLLAGARFLPPLTDIARIAGAGMLALAGILLIRHGFHPENMSAGRLLLTEAGTYSIAGLVLAGALRQISLRLKWPGFDAVTCAYLGLTALTFVALQVLLCNPIFSKDQVSTRIFFNAILYAYGLPSIIALALAPFMPPAARAVRGAGVAGIFVTALLLVRHAFHPGDMTEPGVMMVEAAAYTITVKIIGVLAMEWGIRKKDQDTAFIAQAFLYISLAMALFGQIIFKNPLVSTESVGTLPIINGLLVLYLIPGILLGVQAWQCARRELPTRAKFNAVCALVMGVLFLSFEARWFFHEGGVLTLFNAGHLRLDFLESSTYAPLWLLLAGAVAWVGMKKVKPALVQAGFALQAASVGWVAFALLLLFNPLLTKHSVGAMVLVNGITAGFLIPAAILIAGAGIYHRERRFMQADLAAWTGYVLLFIGYSLTIRQFFQGEFLNALGMGVAERYAYSAGWVLLAVAFLVVGIIAKKHRPRYASLAIMIIGVIKVGYDIFLLQDLYRIFSLAGLGIGLLLITFLYQKYVFKAQDEEEEVA